MDKPKTQPKYSPEVRERAKDGRMLNWSRTYSPEVRERAVRLVFDQVREHPSQWAAIAAKIGCSAATLHGWVR